MIAKVMERKYCDVRWCLLTAYVMFSNDECIGHVGMLQALLVAGLGGWPLV